jgi:hypothetical protein
MSLVLSAFLIGFDLNMEPPDDGFIDLNLPLDEYGAIDFEAPQDGQFASQKLFFYHLFCHDFEAPL